MVVGRGRKRRKSRPLSFFLFSLAMNGQGPSLSTHSDSPLWAKNREQIPMCALPTRERKITLGEEGDTWTSAEGRGRTFVSVFFGRRFSCFFGEIVADRALSSFFRSTTQCFFIGQRTTTSTQINERQIVKKKRRTRRRRRRVNYTHNEIRQVWGCWLCGSLGNQCITQREKKRPGPGTTQHPEPSRNELPQKYSAPPSCGWRRRRRGVPTQKIRERGREALKFLALSAGGGRPFTGKRGEREGRLG